MGSKIHFKKPHDISGMCESTPILLALSGGADSVCLFHLLLDYCKTSNAKLSVVHVNHMIRGEDAERDRDFCSSLAKKYGVPFYLLEADVPLLAREHGKGLEEEARNVRYEFFDKVMRENGIPLLATAHNATDNAETVIFNLVRGSGTKGLCGIPATRDFSIGKIIRPLLLDEKPSILEYCRENGYEFVVDETNGDVAYSRNRIRNNILPELLKINPSAVKNISRSANILLMTEEYMDSLAKDIVEKSGGRINVAELNSLDGALASKVVSKLLSCSFSPSEVHVLDVLALSRNAVPHSRISLPSGFLAIIEDGYLYLKKDSEETPPAPFNVRLKMGENVILDGEMTIFIENEENSIKSHDKAKNIYKKSTTHFISFDTIENGLFIRRKEDGDKILVGGMHKKLKKLFCERKLPLKLREVLPVFQSGDEIIWVPYIASTDTDKKDLKITLYHNF